MNYKGKKGVDISYANGDIDLSKVKGAGFEFVMIRCGYGSDIKEQDDEQFENNVWKAEALGMPWGAYLYSYALNEKEAKSEAEHVKRLLKDKKPTLPVVLDIEDGDGYKSKHGAVNYTTVNAVCKTFIKEIRKAGYYPMLYTGPYYLRNYIAKDVADSVDIWFAHWNTTPAYTGDNLGIWQYGGEMNFLESNSITGVGKIDKNFMYKDYPKIIKDGGYNGWKKPEPKVLDQYGYVKSNESIGVYAIKCLLNAAKKKGLITAGFDDNKKFGEGTQKAVNEFLERNGYAQNGVAGENFIKLLSQKLNERG